MITHFRCSKCSMYQMDVEDLIEHLTDDHDITLKSTEFYVAIAKSIEELEDAISDFEDDQEEERERDEEDDSKDDDNDDSFNPPDDPFPGFGGGGYSGGGASKSW